MVEGVGAAGGLREEIEQLRRDLAEAREQQAATSGVLAVLGRATADLDAVLETVVDSARRLCRADVVLIFLLEGAAYRLAFSSGVLTEENRAYLAQHPPAQDRGTLAGRIGLEGRPQQIVDVLADPEYGRLDIQEHGGFRTTMGVPIVARHGLHFDQARQAGIVFHMISSLSEHGRVGLTAVGDSPSQADATYRRAERILLEEARSALTGPALVE